MSTGGKQWRCYHCDEVFTDRVSATEHFGDTILAEAACRIKLGAERGLLRALRQAEELIAQYRQEDIDLAVELANQQSRHSSALRTAEEAGYHRGLTERVLAPDWTTVKDKRMSDLTPEQQEDAHELWIREQILSFPEHPRTHLTFLLRRLDACRNVPTHDLYQTGDTRCPASILDWNGEVVLGMCRRCGRAEAELTEPCGPRT